MACCRFEDDTADGNFGPLLRMSVPTALDDMLDQLEEKRAGLLGSFELSVG